MTAKADTTRSGAKIQKNKTSACIIRLLSSPPALTAFPFTGIGWAGDQRQRRVRWRHCSTALVGPNKNAR
jgi:hypothetical protein